MDGTVRRLKERRDKELAKSILESKSGIYDARQIRLAESKVGRGTQSITGDSTLDQGIAKMRKQYMSHFDGVDPALMNKYDSYVEQRVSTLYGVAKEIIDNYDRTEVSSLDADGSTGIPTSLALNSLSTMKVSDLEDILGSDDVTTSTGDGWAKITRDDGVSIFYNMERWHDTIVISYETLESKAVFDELSSACRGSKETVEESTVSIAGRTLIIDKDDFNAEVHSEELYNLIDSIDIIVREARDELFSDVDMDDTGMDTYGKIDGDRQLVYGVRTFGHESSNGSYKPLKPKEVRSLITELESMIQIPEEDDTYEYDLEIRYEDMSLRVLLKRTEKW